jgi:peptide/nickel transport system permease protein
MKSKSDDGGQSANRSAKREEYDKFRRKLNLDLPVFYFSISSLSESDTLYRIPKKLHRENLSRLTDEYGDWEKVQDYYSKLNLLNDYLDQAEVTDSLQDYLITSKQMTNDLHYKYQDAEVMSLVASLQTLFSEMKVALPLAQSKLDFLKQSYFEMKSSDSKWRNYIPKLSFYGLDNQYHKWFFGLLVGDFGISYYTKEPVVDMISDRIGPTIILSFLSILIAFAVSIPLGVSSAINQGTKKDKTITIALFFLYSLPSFWVATLLINYLTNPEYLDLFPTIGLKDFEDNAGFWEKMLNYSHHMILPLFCYTYVSFAFISRQMRGSMLQTLGQDYIRTAWAKGLAPKQVYWKHALRNSLLPIITMLASIFPSLIAGSVVIECLFTLPGMGKLAYEAEVIKDYPVIFIIMLFSAILTLIGYLVADILYALVDPRISYSKK